MDGKRITEIKIDRNFILGNVHFQLVNAERNCHLLKNAVHREFMNLSIIYRCYVPSHEAAVGFAVTSDMMEQHGMEADELHEAAKRNTESSGFVTKALDSLLEKSPLFAKLQARIWVVSNPLMLHGAAVMLYPEYLSQLAERLQRDLYILPSSVHEVLALPVGGFGMEALDAEKLRNIVHEVNCTAVSPTDFLSDSVYRYNRESEAVSVA